MRTSIREKGRVALAAAIMVTLAGRGIADAWAGAPRFRDETGRSERGEVRRVDPRGQERLYRVMAPLLRVMDHPGDPKQVRIGIMDDPAINAANAGNAQFYVTRGLLEKANDEELRGVLAHEIAHEDLGHVAKLQMLGTGQIGRA